jgi:uncharacterized protein YbcI
VKTKSEAEAEISKAINQIYRGLLGRVSENIQTRIFDATVLVVFQNVLTVAEVNASKNITGRKIIKDACLSIVENSQDQFFIAVKLATGADVIDMHHDISIETGKEMLFFSLSSPPVNLERSLSLEETLAGGS